MDGERNFTKDEVNKIVEERLSRQKVKDDALLELKNFLFEMRDKGIISGNSVKELAERVKEAVTGAIDKDKAPAVSADSVTVPAAESPVQAEEVTTKNDTSAQTGAEIPEDLGQFLIFCEKAVAAGAMPDAAALIRAYSEAKAQWELRKALCAAKHTPAGQSAAGGAEALLTPGQKSIARSAGISYGEYARLLAEIPKKSFR